MDDNRTAFLAAVRESVEAAATGRELRTCQEVFADPRGRVLA